MNKQLKIILKPLAPKTGDDGDTRLHKNPIDSDDSENWYGCSGRRVTVAMAI